jgi:phenylacetate-CoA ligase
MSSRSSPSWRTLTSTNQPVPAGQPGARVLLTNLANRVQPLIRYEIPDVVTVEPEVCPCGRTLKRFGAVHGRSDDVLSLRGGTLHPLQFAGLAGNPGIHEFQVVQQGDRLRLRVVLGDHAPGPQTTRHVYDQLANRLRTLGLTDVQIDVETAPGSNVPPAASCALSSPTPPPPPSRNHAVPAHSVGVGKLRELTRYASWSSSGRIC